MRAAVFDDVPRRQGSNQRPDTGQEAVGRSLMG